MRASVEPSTFTFPTTAREGRHAPPGMEPKQRRLMIGILLFAALAIPAYWIVWFIDRTILATSNQPSYFVFENAFPLADGWIVLAALLGAVALIRRRASAVVWVPAAGATSVYLALMDLLFDLENGIFKAPTG